MKKIWTISAAALFVLTLALVFAVKTRKPAQQPEPILVTVAVTQTERADSTANDIQRRATAIIADFQDRHPEAVSTPEIAEIEASVKDEMARYKIVVSTVNKISSDFTAAKAALDRAILNGVGHEEIQSLNQKFEEKALAVQQAEKALQETYVETMSAYDTAIAKNLK